MAQTPHSPESHQYQPPEQFPQQPEQLSPQSPEQEPGGQERQAEKKPEQVDRDDRVVLPQVADEDDTGEDEPSDADTQVHPANTQSTNANSMPAIAEDVDVIEKAWVDKAKQIIQDTKDDPHAQEKAFEDLQIEYHKKRYGRDIKAAR